jgi:hypothetical protein
MVENQMFSTQTLLNLFSRFDPNKFAVINHTSHIPFASISASASSRVELGLPNEWSRIHMWLSAIPA